MNHSARERLAFCDLTWSLTSAAGAPLILEYQIQAFDEMYVADRLWDYDSTRRRRPDPFGVYRFAHKGSLRLVFGQAPRPANVMPRVIYQPLYSRIGAQQVHKKKVLIELPVDEYSALARDVQSPSDVEKISHVFLVLSYRLRSTMDRDPAPPPFETAEQAGYIVHDPQQIISSMDLGSDTLPVKRRTGYVARFPLPGEPGPGPMPWG